MVTGYEVGMYRDIGRIADALERIARTLDTLAEHTTGDGTGEERTSGNG